MSYSYLSYASIPYVYGNLLPGFVANLSGQTHVGTYDPDQYGFNPGFALNQCAIDTLNQVGVSTGINVGSSNLPPVQSYVQGIASQVTGQITKNEIGGAMNNVQSVKSKFESMLLSDSISAEDKEKINNWIKDLEKKQDELTQLLKDVEENKIEGVEAQKKAREIKDETRKMLIEATKIGQPSTGEEATETGSATGTGEASGTGSATETEEAEDLSESQGSSETKKTSAKKARELADKFHEAVNHIWGTDIDKFNDACESLDEDNIVDVMNEYKDTYGKSFMEDFMWDASYNQKRNYGSKIMKALREKAISLGIKDECKDDFAAISNQMDKWFWIDNNVYKNYDSIIAKITEKENGSQS